VKDRLMSNPPFQSVREFEELIAAQPSFDASALKAAEARNATLTKPPGALGRLEELALWYCSWRGDARARIAAPQVAIFAGNHGVTAQGVSAFPAEVTAQMVGNFEAGGAAINQLAQTFEAKLTVHPIRLDQPTQDFTTGPAMSDEELVEAMVIGWQSVNATTDLLVVGEMGIGNTTSAAALGALICGGEGQEWVGRGTGVDDAGLARKAQVVDTSCALHEGARGIRALGALGGRELAAMVGAIACARHMSIPVILDGFICTAAALCLADAQDGALDHCVAGHLSAEGGHRRLLKHIGKEPLLSFGLRLGEGSGGALAIGVLQAALNCHSGMATFAEAGVSEEA